MFSLIVDASTVFCRLKLLLLEKGNTKRSNLQFSLFTYDAYIDVLSVTVAAVVVAVILQQLVLSNMSQPHTYQLMWYLQLMLVPFVQNLKKTCRPNFDYE